MAIVLMLEGRKRALNAYLRNVNTNITFKYHLFKNNYAPLKSDTLANYTESNFGSYASQNIVAANWPSPTDDGTCATSTSTTTLTWTSTDASGQNAYGYYVTDNADGALLFAEGFSAAVDMGSVGRSLQLTPAYNNQTGAAC